MLQLQQVTNNYKDVQSSATAPHSPSPPPVTEKLHMHATAE